MDIENEIIENKAKIKMNELKLQSVINLLAREGVITKDEVKKELDKLLRMDEDEDS